MKYNHRHNSFAYLSYKVIAAERRKVVVSYFNEKGALSKDKAIKMSVIDWVELGVNPKQKLNFLLNRNEFSYIKQNENEEYWLDAKSLAEVMDRNIEISSKYAKIFKIVFIVITVIILVNFIIITVSSLLGIGIFTTFIAGILSVL